MPKLLVVLLLAIPSLIIAGPSTSSVAIAAQTDPAKLATLKGERASNPLLQKCVYWLAYAEGQGEKPEAVLDESAKLNKTAGTPYAGFVSWGLLENLKIAKELGLLTPEGMAELKQGKSAIITKGQYSGQKADADDVIPRTVCPELQNQVMNLELIPAPLMRAKSDKVTDRVRVFAKELYEAKLLSEEGWQKVKKAYEKKAEGQSAPPLETEAENQEAVKENVPPAVSLPFVLPVGLGIDQTRVQSATMGHWTYIVGDVVAIITASTATGAVTIPSKLGGLPVLKVGSSHDPIFGFNNTSVTSVSIPKSATTIGAKAFFGCKSLTNITIPKSVRRIDSYAFYGCTSLTSITIPSVSSIGDGAFAYCTKLTSITIAPGTSIKGDLPSHIKVIRR